MNYCSSLFNIGRENLDRSALVEAETGRRFTYRQLQGAVKSCASYLINRGYRERCVIATHLYNGAEAVIAHLAVQYLGHVSCILDPLLRPSELRYYLRDSGSRCLISHGEKGVPAGSSVPGVESIGSREIEQALDAGGPMAAQREPHVYGENELSTLLYTSGTTSLPKAVMLPARCFPAIVSIVRDHVYAYGPEDRLLCFVPFSHAYGSKFLLLPAFAAGATLVMLRSFHPAKIARAIEMERITHLYGVPSHFQQLLRNEALFPALRSLKASFSAAAPLGQQTALDWLANIGHPLQEGYGLSETTTLVTFRRSPIPEPAGNVGVPSPVVTRVEVVDENGRQVADGTVGEMRIRGANVMLGYWNRPEETGASLVGGWFRTGDCAYRRADGSLVLCGRYKELINVAGIKVAPYEIEVVLGEHPAVADAAALGVPDATYGEVPRAYVILKPGKAVTERQLSRFASERLSPLKLPKEVRFVDGFPRNNIGKVDKRELAKH